MPIISGISQGSPAVVSKIYLSKPTDGITVTSTSFASFSTPWTIPNVVVASGKNVLLNLFANVSKSSNNDALVAIFRGATQIATNFYGNIANNLPMTIQWVDENPGAGTYTYEVKALMFTSGTVTMHNANSTADGLTGTSVFVAQVYTP